MESIIALKGTNMLNLANLFSTSINKTGHTRIKTPLIYSDGDLVNVFITESIHGKTLTDFGEGFWRLKGYLPSSSDSSLIKKINDLQILQSLNVNFKNGQIYSSYFDDSSKILNVAQASSLLSFMFNNPLL